MSDTVKLIIEIPKEMYEALLNGYEEPYSRMFSDTVKNGIPLDDVKESYIKKRDIDGLSWHYFDDYEPYVSVHDLEGLKIVQM